MADIRTCWSEAEIAPGLAAVPRQVAAAYRSALEWTEKEWDSDPLDDHYSRRDIPYTALRLTLECAQGLLWAAGAQHSDEERVEYIESSLAEIRTEWGDAPHLADAWEPFENAVEEYLEDLVARRAPEVAP